MSGTRFDRYDAPGVAGPSRPDEAGGPGDPGGRRDDVSGAPGKPGDDIAVTDSSADGTDRRGEGARAGGAVAGHAPAEHAHAGRAHAERTRVTAAAYEDETPEGEAHDGTAHDGAAYDSEPDDHAAHGRDAAGEAAFGGSGSGDGDGRDHGRSHPTGGFGDGFGGEDELRRLLQSRVGGLEPAPDALEQLRRAVPARRQRRRHAVVGAAAAVLLGGTAIPAMVHVANLADGSTDRPANAASSQRAHGHTEGAHGEGTEQAGPRPSDENGAKPGGREREGKGKSGEKNGTGHGAGAGTPAPDATMDVTSPVCARTQLGQGTGTVLPADSAGRVYGSFRVVNTSPTACSVEGGGVVGVVAQGSTNPDRIHVVDHTSGDEATGLPDPATTPDQLVLKPGEAYEVKFAWIPESGGGPTGCANPGPSPTPTPSGDPGQSPESGTTATGDTGGQAGGEEGPGDGGTASGGVVLSHTPEAGEPAATEATIADACAGTVYRTEALATQ